LKKLIRTPAGLVLENLLREAEGLAHELATICPIDAPGMGPAHSRCLEILSLRGPHRLPEIASRLAFTRQRAQQLVETLLAQEAVQRVANPKHRRSPHIEITDRGRELLRDLSQRQTEQYEQAATALQQPALQQALETLRTARRAFTGDASEQ